MEKRALLIGINKYPYMKAKGQLKGCLNDVTAIGEILENQFGFDRNKIRILKNEKATRDGIIREMRKLVADCEPNDIIVFHFSGHGSRRLSKIPGKPNGLEETIVPCDSGRGKHPNREISDENIRAWVSHLSKKTSNITLFFDNCYSGSIVRDKSTEQIRAIEDDKRSFESYDDLPDSDESELIDIFSMAGGNLSQLANRYLMLSACEKDEYAREFTKLNGNKKVCYGAFTYFLVQELSKLPETATYQDLFEQLASRITTIYALQHPQLEGIGQRLLFSGIEKPDFRYVSVENREDKEITLSAGAIHDLTRKSRWGIYPAASSEFSPERKLGTVKITEVGSVSSKARILFEDVPKAMQAGCRAVEEVHFYETPSMSVAIELVGTGLEFFKKEILSRLKTSPWLKTGNRKYRKDTVVRLIQSAEGQIKIAAINKKDDGLLFETISKVGEGAERIVDYLEKLCRYRAILDLYNPFSPLENIEFNLLQKNRAKWHRAKPVCDGLPVYTEGDEIGFEIINKSGVNIYIGILDLGLTKRISLLYPFRAASEGMEFKRAVGDKLINAATGSLTLGKTPRDRITLSIPEKAWIDEIPGLQRRGGKETFKLMIALRQTNFQAAEQSGIVRQRHVSPLEDLIYDTFKGNQTREAERDEKQLNTWQTINRSFYLCKNE